MKNFIYFIPLAVLTDINYFALVGLDLKVHTIIEIACLVTDGELTQKHIVSIETFSLSLSLSLPVSLSILFSNAIVGNV